MTAEEKGFWERIPANWKAILALSAAVTLGFTVSSVLVGFHNLPNRVAANEQNIRTLRTDYREFQADLRSLEKQMALSNCLQISERTGSDWRSCLDE